MHNKFLNCGQPSNSNPALFKPLWLLLWSMVGQGWIASALTRNFLTLALHPEGLSLEALHAHVYGDEPVSVSTLKSEISHLRQHLGRFYKHVPIVWHWLCKFCPPMPIWLNSSCLRVNSAMPSIYTSAPYCPTLKLQPWLSIEIICINW